jgi:hypothetical protein
MAFPPMVTLTVCGFRVSGQKRIRPGFKFGSFIDSE